jgi:hypothetical protein
MKRKTALPFMVAGLVTTWCLVAPANAQTQQKPTVQIPDPGVPQNMTLEGKFVRAAYNNEGYAILGYQLANRSVGEEWMLLEFGAALREKVPDYDLRRDALSLETPDGKTLPLPSVIELRDSNAQAQLQNRAKVQRDSINYFPASAYQPCAIGFFPELGARILPQDDVPMDDRKACVGRLYFQVPGGIKYGQYWLNVKFEKSVVRVPFRILTADEEKLLSKNFGDIRKQVQEAFAPKKKK